MMCAFMSFVLIQALELGMIIGFVKVALAAGMTIGFENVAGRSGRKCGLASVPKDGACLEDLVSCEGIIRQRKMKQLHAL